MKQKNRTPSLAAHHRRTEMGFPLSRIAAIGVLAAALIASYVLWLPESSSATPDEEEYPVRGIDVSAHNGYIDYERVADSGIEFVMIKATEGVSFKDKAFTDNYLRAKKARLRVGAYHFFRFDKGGYEQALNLIHSLRGRELDLPVAIDIEEWGNPREHTTREILTRLRVMVNTLERHGYRVMIYSNKKGFDRFIYSSFAHYPLWLCSFTEQPEAGQTKLWQYTHSGVVDGAGSHVDMNAFTGSRDEWEEWLRKEIPALVNDAQ